jgi:hypothetical protein
MLACKSDLTERCPAAIADEEEPKALSICLRFDVEHSSVLCKDLEHQTYFSECFLMASSSSSNSSGSSRTGPSFPLAKNASMVS